MTIPTFFFYFVFRVAQATHFEKLFKSFKCHSDYRGHYIIYWFFIGCLCYDLNLLLQKVKL